MFRANVSRVGTRAAAKSKGVALLAAVEDNLEKLEDASIINEAETFESTASVATREQMVTACIVPAAAEPLLVTHTAWT